MVPVTVPVPEPQPQIPISAASTNNMPHLPSPRAEKDLMSVPFLLILALLFGWAGSRRRGRGRRAGPLDSAYQSEPSVSPPSMVIAAHQVAGLTPVATRRTLPSPIPTLMPEVWGVLARLPSQQGCVGGCVAGLQLLPPL